MVFDPDYVMDILSTKQNISFFAAPTMIKLLIGCNNAGGDVSGLKTICYGGGPMYLSDCKEALQIFGPRLYQLYGQGEAPMTISNVTKKKCMLLQIAKNYEQILSSVGVARNRSGK